MWILKARSSLYDNAILPDTIIPDLLLITDEVQPLVKTKRRSSGVKTRVERGKAKGAERGREHELLEEGLDWQYSTV